VRTQFKVSGFSRCNAALAVRLQSLRTLPVAANHLKKLQNLVRVTYPYKRTRKPLQTPLRASTGAFAVSVFTLCLPPHSGPLRPLQP